MSNRIGVLGEASTLTVGTTTVYTVPTSKAAKVKLMYKGLLANTGTISITVNGIVIIAPTAATGADHVFSSSVDMYENTTTTAPSGAATNTTVAPAPQEYYLSAGDVVSYTLGVVATTAMSFQVVGTEIDV